MSQLPAKASLEQLKRLARELRNAHRGGVQATWARIKAHHPGHAQKSEESLAGITLSLRDAQLVVAREHGFANWARLKHHIEASQLNLQALIDTVAAGDVTALRRLLAEHPALAEQLDEPHWGFDAPAVVAAAERGLQFLDVLLDAGASVNARSEWWAGGWGVLHKALPEVARHLIARGAVLDAYAAARLDLPDELAALLDAEPARVNAPGPDGMAPLHFAGSVRVASLLLTRGADIDARDADHHGTPAQHALGPRADVCRFLLANGAAADLFMACKLGDVELTRKLLDQNPGALDAGGGRRKFDQSAPGGHIYLYTLGYTARPLSLAAQSNHAALLGLLQARTSPRQQLLLAILRHDGESMRRLLAAQPGLVASLPPEDMCLLSDAAWERDLEALRLMLEAGFDIDARGVHDSTALDRAAVCGFADVIELLLAHRPSLTVINEFGGTPLGACAHCSRFPHPQGDYPRCIELLLGAGAPLPAQSQGTPEVRRVLERHGVPFGPA